MKIISKVLLLNLILLINIKFFPTLKVENSKETKYNLKESTTDENENLNEIVNENEEQNPDDIYGKKNIK